MMTIETKVVLHATEEDIEPLRNFLGWLEDMDYNVTNACDEIIRSNAPVPGISTDIIYVILDNLLDNIEVD